MQKKLKAKVNKTGILVYRIHFGRYEQPEIEFSKQGILGYLVRCDGALQRAAVEALYTKGCVDLPVYLETYLFVRWLVKKIIKPFSSTPNFCFVWDAENIRLRRITIPKAIEESPDNERLTTEHLAIEEMKTKEQLLKGLGFYLNLAGVIQKEDELPKITAFGEMKQSRRIINLKDVVNFISTKPGPNSADAEIQKAILLWGLEKKWDTIWIGGIPKDKLWFIIMSEDYAYHNILSYFKQLDYMNFGFIQISPTNSLEDVPDNFIPWKWIFQVNHEHKFEDIVNKKSYSSSQYRSKTSYLTRIYKR